MEFVSWRCVMVFCLCLTSKGIEQSCWRRYETTAPPCAVPKPRPAKFLPTKLHSLARSQTQTHNQMRLQPRGPILLGQALTLSEHQLKRLPTKRSISTDPSTFFCVTLAAFADAAGTAGMNGVLPATINMQHARSEVNHYHFLYPIAQLFLWLGMLSSAALPHTPLSSVNL